MFTYPTTLFETVVSGSSGLSTPVLLTTFKKQGGVDTAPSSVSITPSANALVMVLISSYGSSVAANNIASVTSGFSSDAWVEEIAFTPATGGADPGLHVWRANRSGSDSGVVTVTWDSSSATGLIHVIEVTGHDTVTPIVNTQTGNGTSGTTFSLTLGAAPASSSIVIGCLGITDTTGATPGSGYTEISDTNTTSNRTWGQESMYDETSPGTTVDWSGLASVERIAAAFEIQAA